MSACPVCAEIVDADQAAFAFHVNSHFDQPKTQSSRQQSVLHPSQLRSAPYSLPEKQSAQPEPTNSDLATCPICNFPVSFLSSFDTEEHLNSCLDGSSSDLPAEYRDSPFRLPEVDSKRTFSPSQIDDDDDLIMDYDYDFPVNGPSVLQRHIHEGSSEKIGEEWDGPARPGGWMDWTGRKVDKGDQWWHSMTNTIDDVPGNITPGVMPILEQTLRTAADQGVTRRAVLSRDVLHIKGVWRFDMGWGCGYRNAMMSISSLFAVPAYAKLFEKQSNGADPGVRRIQGWIQEAWGEGYDAEGSKQFKGKILGSRKWIGPADLYAMFNYKGIPCELYDFPERKTKHGSNPAHIALQQWVKAYFSSDDQIKPSPTLDGPPKSAYDVLMRTPNEGAGRGETVWTCKKFPLILQHSGHSRTIVGYEENSRGDINLLLFDPGRSIPKDIRAAAIAHASSHPRRSSSTSIKAGQADASLQAESSRRPSLPPILTKRSSRSLTDTHEARPFSPPFTNGHSEVVYSSMGERQEGLSEDSLTSNGALNGDSHEFDYSVGASTGHPRGGAGRRGRVGASNTSDFHLEADEEVTATGWVRKKLPRLTGLNSNSNSHSNSHSNQDRNTVDFDSQSFRDKGRNGGVEHLDTVKTLNYFRVNLGTLSRHIEYQVLCFNGGPVLSREQREGRKVLSSTVVRI